MAIIRGRQAFAFGLNNCISTQHFIPCVLRRYTAQSSLAARYQRAAIPAPATIVAARAPQSMQVYAAAVSSSKARNHDETVTFKYSRIAVIGGGSAGIAAAKYLRAEKYFESIVVYEQRASNGGLWQYTPGQHSDAFFNVPQTCPELGPERPVPSQSSSEKSLFVTPVYDALETNIPRHLMELSDFRFKSQLPLFPGHLDVLKYLQAYALEVADCVRHEHQVVEILPYSGITTACWSVKSLDLRTNEATVEEFDAVVVANGHYSVPYVPAITGLAQWDQQHPGSITHSKYFRNTSIFRNKQVVVVGNSASGLDIASQLENVGRLPIYLSQKSVSDMAAGPTDRRRVRVVPEIGAVHADTREVCFVDGKVIRDVDAILFCTGYFYSFPFLKTAMPELITDGTMVNGTYQHIFSSRFSNLAFLALPQKVVPFPVAEMQAAVVARVFAGRLALPSRTDMQNWARDLLNRCGRSDRFHTFGFPSDADYMDMLVDWADQAESRSGLENDGRGKTASRWTAHQRWIRQKIPLIKKTYAEQGNARFSIRSIEELGFHLPKEQSYQIRKIS